MKKESDRLSRLFLLWSALLLLSTASGHIHSPDGEINYRTTRALAQRKGYAIQPLPDGSLTRKANDGNEYSQYGPLQPVLAVPFYIAGKCLSHVVPESWLSAQAKRLSSTVSFYRARQGTPGRSFEGLYPEDHCERVTRTVVSFFNPTVTWITLVLLLSWSRKLFGDGVPGFILPLTYLVGTYAWPHSRPFYTEVLATLFIFSAFYTAFRMTTPSNGAGSGRQSALTGLLTGMAVLTRLDSVVAIPGIVWIALSGKVRTVSGYFQRILPGLIIFLLLVTVIPVQNFMRYGSVFSTGYADQPEGIRFSVPFLDSLWIYFISPGKGLFWYSPPLIPALGVWGVFLRKHRHLCVSSFLIIAGYVSVVGRWQNLGGWCWGPRHIFQTTLFLLLPLPLLFMEPKDKPALRILRIVFLVSLVLGIAVQFTGVLVDYMWALDRELRGVPVPRQTNLVLSLAFYGPLLHLRTWKLDRNPDWFFFDLWRSGQPGAQVISVLLWFSLFLVSLLLMGAVYKEVGKQKRE